jgi:hypothetical protein
MLAINHAAAGVLIGSYLPLPIALPVAFFSHFVMDSFPHFGLEKTQRNQSKFYKFVIYADIIVAYCILIPAIWYIPSLGGLYHNWQVILTGLVAVLPDFTHVWYYLKNGRTMAVETHGIFSGYHKKLDHVERMWGIIPEMILAFGLFWWILERF